MDADKNPAPETSVIIPNATGPPDYGQSHTNRPHVR